MARRKGYKGCCAMCGWHTVRGQGWAKKLPFRDLRKLGKKRRLTRGPE
jgi:hypothetical protein